MSAPFCIFAETKPVMFHKQVIIALFLLFIGTNAKSQQLREWFIDTTDNALDVSNFLATRAGFLPVPMLITEPAVGYGFGMGLLFFHRTKEERETGIFTPMPKGISVVGGLITENGTWAGLLAHQGSWRGDQLRYVGAVGYVDVNLTYYKYLERLGIEYSVGFNLSGYFFYQELISRINKSNLFIGGQYVFFKSSSTLDALTPIFPDGIQSETKTGGLGAQLVWDNRDNIFTTNKGGRSELNFTNYAPYFGGERYYNMFRSKNTLFTPVRNKTVFGAKLDAQFSAGDVPFYGKPYVTLRGVPIMRYQNDMSLVLDTELRQRIYKRWSLMGFIGTGAAIPYENWQENIDFKFSGGAGFRYFLSKMYNMHAGIDAARGPEEWAWYIVVGTYWGR